jgi:hypothetical protein
MRKKWILLIGGALVVLLVAGLAGAAVVSAQEPTPEPGTSASPGWRGGGRDGRGRGDPAGGFLHGNGRWEAFDAAADALGLTPVELFAELHEGKSLEEVAETQGVDPETVYDAVDAARAEQMREAIEQAVEDGTLTREQADRMLEQQEQGGGPMDVGGGMGRGAGRWPGRGGGPGECSCSCDGE